MDVSLNVDGGLPAKTTLPKVLVDLEGHLPVASRQRARFQQLVAMNDFAGEHKDLFASAERHPRSRATEHAECAIGSVPKFGTRIVPAGRLPLGHSSAAGQPSHIPVLRMLTPDVLGQVPMVAFHERPASPFRKR